MKRVVKKLYKALMAAKQHLEYCGYGDSWERECAKEEKLPEKIKKALEEGKKFLEITK